MIIYITQLVFIFFILVFFDAVFFSKKIYFTNELKKYIITAASTVFLLYLENDLRWIAMDFWRFCICLSVVSVDFPFFPFFNFFFTHYFSFFKGKAFFFMYSCQSHNVLACKCVFRGQKRVFNIVLSLFFFFFSVVNFPFDKTGLRGRFFPFFFHDYSAIRIYNIHQVFRGYYFVFSSTARLHFLSSFEAFFSQ